MARKKKHTDFLIGVAGIIPPIVEEFLKRGGAPIPASWESDEGERRKAAGFMAAVAAKPHDMVILEFGMSLPEFGAHKSVSCTLAEEGVKHEADEGEPVEADEGWGDAFIVACQTTEAGGPGKGAFDHPAPEHEHKAAFGLPAA